MFPFYSDLKDSLHTGFVDHSTQCKKEFLPQLLTNNPKKGVKVLASILNELSNCDEFWFSVAFVTTSGVAALRATLDELQAKKIKGKILVSQYQNFTEPEALRQLLKLKNVELRIATEGSFHAKGYLFRKANLYNLIVGSSNLTGSALSTNKEWNVKLSSTDNGSLVRKTQVEFANEFESAVAVDKEFIDAYEIIYRAQKKLLKRPQTLLEDLQTIKPNEMQAEALKNLNLLRKEGKQRALLISATGTGKTYLSAFDVKAFNPSKFLFIVHRGNIAEAAMKSFRRIFGSTRSMGMYSGQKREAEADFVFSTIQTISQDHHLAQFAPDHFEYIVIDETHRAGASSYQKIVSHFSPKFLLGMTATPERTDGFDIFKQFDYNIAYEIRLHKALEEEMLCPFHYYGITDISINGEIIEEDAAFRLLTAQERVERIIEKANHYGCDDSQVRGLVFCSTIEESKALSDAFNARGYKTLALTGNNTEPERATAINRLESDAEDKLDYIFTVDIFNEGIDIPKVNQIIMLRPTQSAIVFVQQLGRGLRKTEEKKYLTVIDFIGNYTNNYLVPIALYGNTSYNKDTLRKLLASGSTLIPGASTVNFDPIAKERIFAAIDAANLSKKKDLQKDYQLLKFELGRIPMMMDFILHGSRDPYLYVDYTKSYFNFVAGEEEEYRNALSRHEAKLLELISSNIANGKRVEEVMLLKQLISKGSTTISSFKQLIADTYGIAVSNATIYSCIINLNFEFVNAPEQVVTQTTNTISFDASFSTLLKKPVFYEFVIDVLNYGQAIFDQSFDREKFIDGFQLYHKYSRKDVCRILNWERDEHSTMYGYKVKYNTCPIFVNYHKAEDIASTTKYEDKFLSNTEFQWMSRSRRTLQSKELQAIQNYKDGLRLPLFVKKDNDEGADFYYMGEVTPESFEETTISDDKGQLVSIVRTKLLLSHQVEDSIYRYITEGR